MTHHYVCIRSASAHRAPSQCFDACATLATAAQDASFLFSLSSSSSAADGSGTGDDEVLVPLLALLRCATATPHALAVRHAAAQCVARLCAADASFAARLCANEAAMSELCAALQRCASGTCGGGGVRVVESIIRVNHAANRNR